MDKRLFGIPNGSLQAKTLELLERIGVRVTTQGRRSEAAVEGISLFEGAIFARPQDLPGMVASGVIACALCGWDWVVEYCPILLVSAQACQEFVVLQRLSYAKQTSTPARVVLFRKKEMCVSLETPSASFCAEYPHLAEYLFPSAKIVFSHGSTEVKVAKGMYDYGVGITETGDSLRDDGLVIERTLLESPVVLLAKKSTPEFIAFGELLAGALAAEPLVLVKMNMPDSKTRDQAISLLPSLNSPTVNELANGEFALETIVPKKRVVDLFISLRTVGATGWVQHNIDVVVV